MLLACGDGLKYNNITIENEIVVYATFYLEVTIFVRK